MQACRRELRMKVLHLIKTAEGATWAYRQIIVLLSLGVVVEAVLPGGGRLSDLLEAAGVRCHFATVDIAALKRPRDYLRSKAFLQRLVEKECFDLIHSHFVGTTIFARLALGRNHKTPRVFQVPGPLHLENVFTRNAEYMTAGKYDYWLASCSATREHYRKLGVPEEKLGLAFYGLDFPALFAPKKAVHRGDLGISETSEIVGMVAYIYGPKRWLGQKCGLKGHEDLIKAGAKLLKDGRDVVMVFVGGAWGKSQPYENRLKRLASNLLGTRGVFLGNRSDVPSLYRLFDVAVHPSHSENLGGAAESLALGVPTIATNVGGFPDIVIDDVTGQLVPVKDPIALADAIAKALDNPVEARVKADRGAALARSVLDVTNTGRAVYDFYRRLLPSVR